MYFCCIQHPNLQVLVFLLSFWWADWYCIISSCYQQLILISIPLWFTVSSKIFRSTVCNECFSLTRITSWVFAHVMSVSKSHKLSLNYIFLQYLELSGTGSIISIWSRSFWARTSGCQPQAKKGFLKIGYFFQTAYAYLCLLTIPCCMLPTVVKSSLLHPCMDRKRSFFLFIIYLGWSWALRILWLLSRWGYQQEDRSPWGVGIMCRVWQIR